MEPKGLSLCLHEPTTWPYTEPDEVNPHLPILFL